MDGTKGNQTAMLLNSIIAYAIRVSEKKDALPAELDAMTRIAQIVLCYEGIID